jgi:hypothetical protein
MALGQPERALDPIALVDAVVVRLGYQVRLLRAGGDEITSVPPRARRRRSCRRMPRSGRPS